MRRAPDAPDPMGSMREPRAVQARVTRAIIRPGFVGTDVVLGPAPHLMKRSLSTPLCRMIDWSVPIRRVRWLGTGTVVVPWGVRR